jgi:hypothetical protein
MKNRTKFVAFCYTLIAGLVAIYLLTLHPAWLMFAGTVGYIALTLNEGEE